MFVYRKIKGAKHIEYVYLSNNNRKINQTLIETLFRYYVRQLRSHEYLLMESSLYHKEKQKGHFKEVQVFYQSCQILKNIDIYFILQHVFISFLL